MSNIGKPCDCVGERAVGLHCLDCSGWVDDSAYPTRGHRINRKATIGARLVTLRTLIAETEKSARKTPPKTLVAEKERVATAKAMLPLLVAECVALTAEQAMLEALDRPETASPKTGGHSQ